MKTESDNVGQGKNNGRGENDRSQRVQDDQTGPNPDEQNKQARDLQTHFGFPEIVGHENAVFAV
jgi:hypothetical protein